MKSTFKPFALIVSVFIVDGLLGCASPTKIAPPAATVPPVAVVSPLPAVPEPVAITLEVKPEVVLKAADDDVVTLTHCTFGGDRQDTEYRATSTLAGTRLIPKKPWWKFWK